MVKELWKDCKYITRIVSQQFKTVVSIKVTLIPILAGLGSFLAAYFSFLSIPDWVWISVTFFTTLLCILFLMARKARTIEEPKITVNFDETHPDFMIPVSRANSHVSGTLIRVLPKTSSNVYAGAVLNSVHKKKNQIWEETALNEALHLKWSNTGFTMDNIDPKIRRFLDIAIVWSDGEVEPCVETLPVHTKSAFNSGGIYRFDIVMTTSSHSDKTFSLEIEFSKRFASAVRVQYLD